MRSFDSNKYRLKFLGMRVRENTRAYPRSKAVEVMADSLKKEAVKMRILKFDGKEISKEHHRTLWKCAVLWNSLTELENGAIQRRRKPKESK